MTYRIVLREARYAATPSYWWWVLKSAGNGAVLATSETYSTRRKALAAAQALADALGIEVDT